MQKNLPSTIDYNKLHSIPDDPTFGVADTVEQKDIRLPRLMIMQKTSKMMEDVSLGAKLGEWRSSDGELMSVDGKLDVLIFLMRKYWVIKRLEKTKWKYFAIEDHTVKNADAPWQFETDEGTFKRILTYDFTCCPTHKLMELPYVFTLAGTSRRAAQAIATKASQLRLLKKSSASVVFQLSSHIETSDENSFHVVDAKATRNATPTELETVYSWHKVISASRVTVDEPDDAVDKEHDEDESVRY